MFKDMPLGDAKYYCFSARVVKALRHLESSRKHSQKTVSAWIIFEVESHIENRGVL